MLWTYTTFTFLNIACKKTNHPFYKKTILTEIEFYINSILIITIDVSIRWFIDIIEISSQWPDGEINISEIDLSVRIKVFIS